MRLCKPHRLVSLSPNAGKKSRKTLRIENLESRQLLAADVTITEFMAKNDGFLRDGQNKSPDWIELYNSGDEAVDLQGYQLTDTPDAPSHWTFPSKILQPGEYLVVFASGNNFVDEAGYLHTDFRLGAGGEYVGLISPEGQVVSHFGSAGTDFPAQRSNVSYGVSESVTLINQHSDLFYKVPIDDSDDAQWMHPGFDETAHGFTVGKSALGVENRPFFRENLVNEIVTQLPEGSKAVYARIHFEVDDAAAVDQLLLDLKYDNGFVAYLNGHVVASDNTPENPDWSSAAVEKRPTDGESANFTVFDLSQHTDKLVTGDNVLALHGMDHRRDKGDILIAPQLRTIIPNRSTVGHMPAPTPGAINQDAFHGFVEDISFSLVHGFYDSVQFVDITVPTEGVNIYYTTDNSRPRPDNPSATRYTDSLTIDRTTTLRAAAFKDDHVPSHIETQTYIFVDDVIAGLPNKFITEHAFWGPQVRNSLLSVPTISIVTQTEIREDTILQEIPISIEFMTPDGSGGFQVNAGLEHFGGGALTAPKKSMRVSFKGIYGESQLEYDIFGNGATMEFDQFLLRAGSQDRSSWGGGSYVRNRWAFDRQLEMGHLAPHGRFVQVYINGRYWGVHHLMERPNAAFMASYLGGDKDDYESINRDSLVDGDGSQYENLKAQAGSGDYELVKSLLDEVNYADYMLLMFYAGNSWDWGPKANWMGATDPPGGEGYKFFAWDSDFIMRQSMEADLTDNGGPGDIWNSVRQYEEFRVLFADRAQRLLFDNGSLTRDRVLTQFDALEDQILPPVVAEMARWNGSVETLVANLDVIRTWNGRRNEYLIEQLRNGGLFPMFDAPTVLINGEPRHRGPLATDHQIELESSVGAIYYTLDGSDPRQKGGDISPHALVYDSDTGALVLQSDQTVKARVLYNDQWSALRETEFVIGDLWITEMNFHPHRVLIPEDGIPEDGANDIDATEFIELMNVGSQPLELEGIRFSAGVRFTFATQTLQPGERIVVVEDVGAFRSRYGNEARIASGNDGEDGRNGEFGGRLANEGERIRLEDPSGNLIQQFTYDESDRWPVLARGLGSSLQIVDVLKSADNPDNWRPSHQIGGSPGSADLPAQEVVINEVLSNPQAGDTKFVELRNTTDRTWDIGGWYISDTSDDLFRFQLAADISIPAGGYHLIDQQQLGSHFSIRGGELWLTEADSNGLPVRFVNHVEFGAVRTGLSQGRWPTSNDPLLAMSESTPGRQNSRPWVASVIISEIHTNPVDADGNGDEVEAKDSYFIELYNRSDVSVDLSGWQLDGDTQYTFPSETTIGPGEAIAVTSSTFRDRDVLRKFFGMAKDTQLLGQLSQGLRESSGHVSLLQPLAIPPDDPVPSLRLTVDEIRYDSSPPWPSPDAGRSFVRTQPGANGALAENWKDDDASPGRVNFERIIGDVNQDGVFSSQDLVEVFRAGKYNDGIPNNATFEEGDWNLDGDFDDQDIVAAFIAGGYVPDPMPASSALAAAIDAAHADDETKPAR